MRRTDVRDNRARRPSCRIRTNERNGDETHDLLGGSSETETTETADMLATDTVTTNYIRDPSGEVLGYSRGNLNRFFVRDLTGTVIDITNNGGNRMSWYDYSPYGELLGAGDGTEFLPFRFAQGYLDEETGLQKHGVRYYGMGIARWTQLDPVFGQITDPITLNRYQYANCDPSNNADPSGRSICDNPVVEFFNPASHIILAGTAAGSYLATKVLLGFGTAGTAASILGAASGLLTVAALGGLAVGAACFFAEAG